MEMVVVAELMAMGRVDMVMGRVDMAMDPVDTETDPEDMETTAGMEAVMEGVTGKLVFFSFQLFINT
jgi:hypothetical protein